MAAPTRTPVAEQPAAPRPGLVERSGGWLNLILSGVGRTLITCGVIVFLFAGFQLWGTGVEESAHQSDLAKEAARRLDIPEAPSGGDDNAAVDQITTRLAAVDPRTAPPAAAPAEGAWGGLIAIPAIGLSPRSFVEGVSKDDLRKGPGHYPTTPMPGQPGNAAIAGHRTTYGAPFNRIAELKPGDRVEVYTTQGKFTYEVLPPPAGKGLERGPGWFTVRPTDTWVLDQGSENLLTLTACHPEYSARERIVVQAKLVAEPAATTTTTTAPASPTVTTPAPQPTNALDEGLSGDPGARLPAALYLLGFFAVWLVAWVAARAAGRRARWARWVTYLVIAPGAGAMLWFCFVYADRALPSL